MPVVIEVQLLAGRYHAHVWGEAQFAMAGAEWPPSPWRLLRAVASVWFAARPAPCTAEARDAILDALGCCASPGMWLPATAFREVRYYQPLEHKRALHHDFFAIPEGGRFYFAFDTSLTAGHWQLLDDLLHRLRYLGRAESRALLRLDDKLTTPPPRFFRVMPREYAKNVIDWTPQRVLCPSSDREFRASDLWSSRVVRPSKRRKKQTREDEESAGMPVHLVDALLAARKPLPDGARWVEYALPTRSIVHEVARSRRASVPEQKQVETKCIVFRLCRRIPIPLGEAVALARAYRDAAVRNYRANTGGPHSRTLTGREKDGSVALGNQHMYYLPQPGGGRSSLATLVLKVPLGTSLDQEELDALMSVERVVLEVGDRYPITVVPEQAGAAQLVEARTWKSITPFLPPLGHRSGRTATLLEMQLASCLERSCGVVPVRTAKARGPGGTGILTPVRAHQYFSPSATAQGRSGWRLTRRLGHWFTVEFDTPVVIGVPVGADAHFGLGQFAPIED